MVQKNVAFNGVGYLDLELSDIKAVYRTREIPVNCSASGYGNKIPTQYLIKTVDNRIHRVYCICYSNSGSLWINYHGKKPMVETAILDYEIKNNIDHSEFPYYTGAKK